MNQPLWLIVIQLATAVATVGTLIVYLFMLIAMRSASQGQNILTVFSLIQQPHIHNARRILLSLRNKPLDEWSQEERLAADIACGTYDQLAILLKSKVIPLRVITDNWGNSIRECRRVASPLIAQYRQQRGPGFWDDLDWLCQQVEQNPLWKSIPEEPTSTE